MKTPGVIAAATALAVAFFVAPARAQSPSASYSGQRIVDVQLVAEGRPIVDPMIAGLVETRVGDDLSMSQVRESISHIFGLGRFQDVQVDATATTGGVTLRYNLIPLHNVQRVEFRGTPSLALSADALRDAVTGRFGASPSPGRAQEIARFIEQHYRDRGYLAAAVVPNATERHDPDRTLLSFDVNPGPRAVIGTVEVEGVSAKDRDGFLHQIHAASSSPYQPLVITD